MKPGLKWFITFLTITLAIAALTIPTRLKAQNQAVQGHHHYKLIDLGTFGGLQSHVNAGSGQEFGNFSSILNSRGIVTGWADTSTQDPFPGFCLSEECYVVHTFEWKNGVKTDLGVLPGGASSESNWVTENGLIVGLSENGEIDPLIPGFPEFHATLWRDGSVIDLGTLPGGFESIANAANSRGQVVGLATKAVADPNSMLGLGFQTRAFIWQDGVMEDLKTLPGGADAEAVLINEKGQVVGWSYTSSTSVPPCETGFTLTTGSFIWDMEKGLRDIGSLGGSCTIATDLNNRGQVVGSSSLPGDTSQHAFLWDEGLFQDLGGSLGGDSLGAFAVNEKGEAVGFAFLPGETPIFHATLWRSAGDMVDLGVVGADPSSYAASINSRNQVVGTSGDFVTTSRVFLWENGDMVDLKALILGDSAFRPEFAQTINDRGEIAGTGADAGNEHAFLAIPCDENHPGVEGCDYSLVDAAAAKNRTRSDSSRRDASLASPALETTKSSPEIQRSLGGANSLINQMFRRRFGVARSLRAPHASPLTTASTTGLTITSGAPPSGIVGQPYGPFQFLWRPNIFTKIPVHFFQMSASGGSGSYSGRWAAAPGSSLPPGLACCELILEHTFPGPVGGEAFYYPVIYGQPTSAGTYHVVVTLTDNNSPLLHASASYSITISQ